MDSTFVRNENIIWRGIDNKIVMVSSDARATYVLNKTAAYIWQLCDGTKGLEEIAADLCDKFNVLPEDAAVDVSETISKLEKIGLLKRKQEKV